MQLNLPKFEFYSPPPTTLKQPFSYSKFLTVGSGSQVPPVLNLRFDFDSVTSVHDAYRNINSCSFLF